jgi:hypothetical protein
MPIKLFSDGQILNASEVNTYFMDQALCVFDDAAARDAAFGGVNEPTLQEGRICYLKDDDTLYIYTGSAWTAQLADIADGVISTAKLDGTSGSEAVTTAKIRTGAVTSDKIANGTIVNADISDTAAIALSKLATGALPTGITVASANIDNLTIATEDINDDAVTSAKLGTSLTFTGTTTFEQIVEKATTDSSTVLSSTATNINILSGAVYRFTSASHTTGFKLNLRGDGSNTLASLMTANSQAVTVALSVVSGSSAISFAASDYLTIDTSATVTIKWFGGTKPSGNANSEDFYTFTIFKTGSSAFTVFASQSKFA